jgi:beta-galactosidase
MGLYASALAGVYRALFDADVPVTFVHEDAVRAHGVPANVRSLYWPLPMVADLELAAALRDFVGAGGLLVAEAAPGQHGPTGRYSTIVPGAGLDALFGVRGLETDVRDDIAVILNGGERIPGAWQYEHLEVATAEVLGEHVDGGAAVTVNRFGDGRALLIATYPSLAYDATRSAALRAWLVDTLRPQGSTSPLRWLEPAVGRFHRVLSTPDGWRGVIALNATDDPAAFALDGAEGTVPARSGRLVELSS